MEKDCGDSNLNIMLFEGRSVEGTCVLVQAMEQLHFFKLSGQGFEVSISKKMAQVFYYGTELKVSKSTAFSWKKVNY